MRAFPQGIKPPDPTVALPLVEELGNSHGLRDSLASRSAFEGSSVILLVYCITTRSLPRSPPADGARLRSRSSAYCRSVGAIQMVSSVQDAMVPVASSAVAWVVTHWMIHRTRNVARTTPAPAQESWSHRGGLGLSPANYGSPTRASVASRDSVAAPWSVDGAPLFD